MVSRYNKICLTLAQNRHLILFDFQFLKSSLLVNALRYLGEHEYLLLVFLEWSSFSMWKLSNLRLMGRWAYSQDDSPQRVAFIGKGSNSALTKVPYVGHSTCMQLLPFKRY